MSADESTTRYQSMWDSYWGSLTGAPGEVFWDVSVERAVERELPLFKDRMTPELPLVDLGCGSGIQTRLLAERFGRVIGVDVSPEAVAKARRESAAPGLEYRVLDGTREGQAAALHDEIGDANIYMRGVLHQLQPADRPACVRSIEAILGARGVIFLVELTSTAAAFFAGMIAKHGAPPPALARVLQHGIAPANVQPEEWEALFPASRFEVLSAGPARVGTSHELPDGGFLEVPAEHRLLRPRQG